MKKQGFTLAETLITLGIIGVVATLISPSLKQLIPSREKMEFMECFKLTTNALNAIDYTLGKEDFKYVYDTVTKKGMIYPRCQGLACVDIGAKISEAVGVSNYVWTAGSPDVSYVNSGNTEYYTSQDVTCSKKNSSYSFVFTLNGSGTIKALDEKGKIFMKDQFNYHKKDNE